MILVFSCTRHGRSLPSKQISFLIQSPGDRHNIIILNFYLLLVNYHDFLAKRMGQNPYHSIVTPSLKLDDTL